MDFELNDDQQSILEAVHALLEQHAGPARAIELQPESQYDFELEAALFEAGFVDVARDDAMGALEATLVTEAVAGAAGVMGIAAASMVAPQLGDTAWPLPLAIVRDGHGGPVRFCAQARTLLVLGADEARVVELAPGDSKPVASNFGYPMGSVPSDLSESGRSLGSESASHLERWWRLALAAECVGTMSAALDQTVGYLKERKQFGRTIASFQAVQHRLAECAIAVEGSRWLAREAAYKGAPPEMAATAAAYALQAAERVFSETHQLSGAIGYTREHDLHVWSMRLLALRFELEGATGHRRALVDARWGAQRGKA